MLFYLTIITVAFILALANSKNNNNTKINQQHLGIFCFLLFLFIGTRDGVGSDWESYVIHLELTRGKDLFECLKWGDPAYVLLEWIGANIFGEIYFVNIVCSSIFIYGTYRMAVTCENSWGFLFFMIPYGVYVVGMAYTRQSVAIGLEMLAILSLYRGNILKFLMFVIIGTLFHKTALVLFLLVLPKKILIKTIIFITFLLLGILTFSEHFNEYSELLRNYTTQNYFSLGMVPRVIIYSIFFIVFIVYYKKKFILGKEKYVIRNFYIMLTPLILTTQFFSTTIADRLLLYSLPVSGIIFSNILKLFKSEINPKIIFFQYILNLIVFVIWYVNSPYAEKWANYNSILL